MVYDIRPQSLLVIIFLSLMIIWQSIRSYFGLSSPLFLFIFVVAVFLLVPIRIRFEINEDRLVYQILFFNESLFRKEIHPSQIKQVKFFRAGWAKKAATIKVKKGMNMRLAVLEPQEAYAHLIEFAEKYELEIFKTKDYLILERMRK